MFLGILNFKNFFFLNLGLKGVTEKCRLFPCIPIFRGFFRLKSVKKMCLCDVIKTALLFMKSIFINVKKGMSKLGRWLAAKHTTKTWYLSFLPDSTYYLSFCRNSTCYLSFFHDNICHLSFLP